MLQTQILTIRKHLRLFSVIAVGLALLAPVVMPLQKAFATPGPAPINVRTFVGGNSIAVLWNPAVGDTPTQYKIYRGGVLKATVAHTLDANTGTATTQRWYDTTVVNGTSYSYQVSAVNSLSEESALTTAVNVTQPASPVAVPTVTVDPSTPAHLVTFANNAKALIQTWYPKFVTKLGNPASTPTSITLLNDPTLGVNAQVSGTTIKYQQAWAEANATSTLALNTFLHESIHVAQLGSGVTQLLPWVHEGMADYAVFYWFAQEDNYSINLTTDNWQQGYSKAAYFFKYISDTYSKPDFVKDLDASFDATNKYSETFFKTQTGLTVGELWQQMGGRRLSSPSIFKNVNASFTCLGTNTGTPVDGSTLHIQTCTTPWAQQIAWIPDSISSKQGELRILGMCFDVASSGTADGTAVRLWTCNSGVAQKWKLNINGAVTNPNSGKCLQPVGGSTTLGTTMEIMTCSGGSAQDWFQRPPGSLKTFAGIGCAAPASSSAGAIVAVYSCPDGVGGTSNWKFVPSSVGSTQGALMSVGANKCAQPVGGSTAANTLIEIATCNGTNIQKWQWQADNTVKNIGSTLCLTLPAWASPWQLTQTMCSSPGTNKKWDVLYQF